MDEKKRPKGRPTIYDGSQTGWRNTQGQKPRPVHGSGATVQQPVSGDKGKVQEAQRPVNGDRVKQQGAQRPVNGDRVKQQGAQRPAGEPMEAVCQERETVTPKPGKRRREQENEAKIQTLRIVLGVLIVALLAAIFYEIILGHGTKLTGGERMAAQKQTKQELITDQLEQESETETQQESEQGNGQDASGADQEEQSGDVQTDMEANMEAGEIASAEKDELAAQAELKAMQYDYDGAIELLKSAEGYGKNTRYQAAVAEYQKIKETCVPYPAEEVTHVFFHTLIHDPQKAFDGDEYEAGYNQFMVTEYEFNSIIQQMYDRGYVMVFLTDFTEVSEDENGNRSYMPRDIMLPPGKIPFVLSQDDVSYYHYMEGDGYASRLIVDESGKVKNEYIEDDGSISVGDYDMVPLIDRFVEKHPDFSYRGAKGYVALTGYEGILGYRTDEVYKTKEPGRVTVQQQMFFDSYPGGFDEAAFEKECESAKKVAEAMKEGGWKFASHTWGHQNLHETNGIDYDRFVRDTDRWETWVEPLIGETDTLIYAFGGDIQDWEPYSGDRFNYLKEAGFEYYCGVDSSKYAVQVGNNYVRQSRRNIDGYRMYYNPEMLEDLFDVSQAWDPARPDYVPGL